MTMAWSCRARLVGHLPVYRASPVFAEQTNDWEQQDRRSLTWRYTENFRLTVTPSIFIFSTWVKPETVHDGTVVLSRILGLTKIIAAKINDVENLWLSHDNDQDYKFVLSLEKDSIWTRMLTSWPFSLLTITLRHCAIDNNCSMPKRLIQGVSCNL